MPYDISEATQNVKNRRVNTLTASEAGARAILASEDDWRAVQETLYLLSVPGMRESIRKGMKTPVKACAKELDW